jgi:hypothetical protein
MKISTTFKSTTSMKNVSGAKDHLMNHQTYPATKAELVASCNDLSDFSAEDKKEFEQKIPDKTYNSADEVIAALGM